jgi:hypothetical protein
VIRLPDPAPDASEVGTVRQLVHDALPRLSAGH